MHTIDFLVNSISDEVTLPDNVIAKVSFPAEYGHDELSFKRSVRFDKPWQRNKSLTTQGSSVRSLQKSW